MFAESLSKLFKCLFTLTLNCAKYADDLQFKISIVCLLIKAVVGTMTRKDRGGWGSLVMVPRIYEIGYVSGWLEVL